jgi:hypothetical protein
MTYGCTNLIYIYTYTHTHTHIHTHTHTHTHTGTSTFIIKASKTTRGPLAVAPGSELLLRVVWGFDSVLSEGLLTWPAK